ncbi:DUF2490 domain-containing protein [Polaribacter porphyrae]|nr:DUF2490 domain-containing protein [Polaribacter porphyrae]
MQTITSQNTSDKFGNWFMYNGSHKIAENWKIQTMAHFRYYELADNFQQEIYRLATNYSIHKKLNVSIGYSYVTTDVVFGSPDPIVYENRIYEDINYTNFINKLKIRHRFRFEHRFITANATNSESHWFRYDLNLNYPISKSWSVYVFNEIFFNMDKSKRFVQNWTGFGFLHKLNQSIKLNFGYQQIKLPNDLQKRLLLGIILNTNHIKK